MTTVAYYQPTSIEDALTLMETHGPSLLVMAGGTLAMPLINEGISFPENVLSLRKIGLNKIEKRDGFVVIGAATTMSQIIAWNEIPMLVQAANEIGGWAVRNMGTVGGNLFAPPPAGDFATALLALDAQVKIVGGSGERVIPLAAFYTGFMTTALDAGELISELQVPWPKGTTAYIKYGRKQSNTPSIVTVAVRVVLDGDAVSEARIALNAVGPHPFRATQAETSLIGKTLGSAAIKDAAMVAADQCEPFTDAIATEWYRRTITGVYVQRALSALA